VTQGCDHQEKLSLRFFSWHPSYQTYYSWHSLLLLVERLLMAATQGAQIQMLVTCLIAETLAASTITPR
jgi:hypothetical protein